MKGIPYCEKCDKDAYPGRGSAKRGMRWLQQHRKAPAMRIYPCPRGRGFHLTSQVDKKKRERER